MSSSDREEEEVIILEAHATTPPITFTFDTSKRDHNSFLNPGGDRNCCGLKCLEWICKRAGGNKEWETIANELRLPYKKTGFKGMASSDLRKFIESNLPHLAIIEYQSSTPPRQASRSIQTIKCRQVARIGPTISEETEGVYGVVCAGGRRKGHWWVFEHNLGDFESG